jgi:2-oxoglutarate ferredoxin oxidoreductase subunit alpha
VRLTVKGRVPVQFYGRLGGMVPFPDELVKEIQRLVKDTPNVDENPREAWFDRMMATS